MEYTTRTALFDALRDRVAELHSYYMPQVVATPIVGGLTPYLNWIAEETTARGAESVTTFCGNATSAVLT